MVWKALWGAPITEVREVDDDGLSKAAGDDQFIAGAGVAAQAAARVLCGATGAFGSSGKSERGRCNYSNAYIFVVS